MTEKILITGATGTIGNALVKALLEKNATFVAAVRNPEAAREKLGPDVDMVTFAFKDATTFEAATKGITKVFLLGPPIVTNLEELLTPFINFLKSKSIIRVVYVGALGLEHVKELPFHTNLIAKLKDDDFNYTILKPSFFSQNFKNYAWENITQKGVTFFTAGSGKAAFIDVEDVAAVAATVLTEEGHGKKAYELTGPVALSYFDAAAALSEVVGKPIFYPNPSPAEYTNALKTAGAPDFIAPYMISVYSLIANHYVDYVTSDVLKVTGKNPSTLTDVLERDFTRAKV